MEENEFESLKNNYLFGLHPVMEAISAGKNIDKIYLKKGLEGEQFRSMMVIIEKRNIPFQFVPGEKLDRLVRGRHQGIVALMANIDYTDLGSALEKAMSHNGQPLVVMLDGVSDVRNFGSVARTAECAGADFIILPAKGGAPINADAIKTSAGALMRIDVCKVPNLKIAIYQLLQKNFQIVAATEKCDSPIYDIDFKKATAIILGSEGKGISSSVMSLATAKAKIPMNGEIGSLNVSNAAAIVLYEAVRQRRD
ncbi:MAG: 23S rRNA (guanosine(2251)-2'-O)-methyltransferase RlmB [Bacteroidales bacterium]|jgi:23S rRNA (guanosine2251-2'-O)-methyltransferase|nr:23S rRNA (guanosine(2251)-2'-O)-methyltransferase RlmB [Bacteroidales bacterium]